MKGINTSGQAMDSGGVASFSAPRDGISHLAFPALARERNHHADSFPLAPLGNQKHSQESLPLAWRGQLPGPADGIEESGHRLQELLPKKGSGLSKVQETKRTPGFPMPPELQG
ncbi:hypothetical protein [Sphaerochaeta halotolerans]|uniref:hypothetical protein n=1 Tax=Sphaerochaeta halotolerans TaxID=2293840 RepID=UPI00136BF0BF|nr:hypothetical protein [Sphaerochaeta halotolerans]MXI86875.1 hypothetical protein [Sphaerochaeta halotolerans]